MAASAAQFERARAVLPPEVRVVELTTDDAWMRDIGPTFVVDGHGGRRGRRLDLQRVGRFRGRALRPVGPRRPGRPQGAARSSGPTATARPIVLEGGSIHVDGEGTLLTTEQCLLNPNRNPASAGPRSSSTCATTPAPRRSSGWATACYEDETDGHIDNLCCFVRPGRRRPHLDRRPRRSAARDLDRRPPPARGGGRRARPLARGAPAAPARPAAHDRRRSRRHRPRRRGQGPAAAGPGWPRATSTSTSPTTGW